MPRRARTTAVTAPRDSRSFAARVMLPAALLLASCEARGCHEDDGIAALPDLAQHADLRFLDVSFEQLYPTFLFRKSMSEGEKAARWVKYAGGWVRWEGVIMSFTENGITLKQLLATVTFDVSLTCGAGVAKTLRQRYAVGDRVRYIGRLDSYDDIFHTLYLTQGAVGEKRPQADLGVVPDLAR